MAAQALHLLVLLFTSIASFSVADPDEGAALLRFRAILSGPNNAFLPSWVPNSAPCVINRTTWDGIICVNGGVWGVRLEGRGLSGHLNLGPLVDLPRLRTLSFMHNELEGPLPDLRRLGALKAIYLSDNKFSGEISDVPFANMRSLKKVFLSRNQFSGLIPTTLAALPKLLEARLDHNKFSGKIPDFWQPRLEKIDVSFNSLDGAIPQSLGNMNPLFFQGNDKLCGAPLSVVCKQNSQPKNHHSGGVIALICSGFIIGLLLFFAVILVVRRRQETAAMSHPSPNEMDAVADQATKMEEGLAATSIRDVNPASISTARVKKIRKESGQGILLFMQDGTELFCLDDLLSAPRKMVGLMGRYNLSDTYKAFLPNGPKVLVKRFRHMNDIGREYFEEHMRRIGRLFHPNILPLVAYVYEEEEKLMITNLVDYEILDYMLHGNRGLHLPPLDWPTRLKIVKGVARGLAYLYDKLPNLVLPHGHLKSSSVLLLKGTLDPLLTDYALAPIMNAITARKVMAAYQSPEAIRCNRPTKRSDVWSLGILILEILTGSSPENFRYDGCTNIATWVTYELQEGRSKEVFDRDLADGWDVLGEMLKLLHIGLVCCEEAVERRLNMKEALFWIEQVNESAT